jgi:hypothetical protein
MRPCPSCRSRPDQRPRRLSAPKAGWDCPRDHGRERTARQAGKPDLREELPCRGNNDAIALQAPSLRPVTEAMNDSPPMASSRAGEGLASRISWTANQGRGHPSALTGPMNTTPSRQRAGAGRRRVRRLTSCSARDSGPRRTEACRVNHDAPKSRLLGSSRPHRGGIALKIRPSIDRSGGDRKPIAVLLGEDGTAINVPRTLRPRGVKARDTWARIAIRRTTVWDRLTRRRAGPSSGPASWSQRRQ